MIFCQYRNQHRVEVDLPGAFYLKERSDFSKVLYRQDLSITCRNGVYCLLGKEAAEYLFIYEL